jgi:hypothetical protein
MPDLFQKEWDFASGSNLYLKLLSAEGDKKGVGLLIFFSAGVNGFVSVGGGHEAGGAFSGHFPGIRRLHKDLESQGLIFFHCLGQTRLIGGESFSPALGGYLIMSVQYR